MNGSGAVGLRDSVGNNNNSSNTNLKSYIQDLKKVAQSNKHKRAIGGAAVQ